MDFEPRGAGTLDDEEGGRHMDAWEQDDVEAARTAAGRLYHEFLSVPDLSAGLAKPAPAQ